MRVAIAGATARSPCASPRSCRSAATEVVALIRNPDHADDVKAAGAEPTVVDLEQAIEEDVAAAITGCDAVVFAAGAGPGSGSARKDTMDYGGAVKLIEAAKRAGIRRYVIVSTMDANPDAPGR